MPNTKKRASKKHDPKQLFTLCQYSREAIAEELNTAIEVTGSDVKEFESDDPRLTDKVCQEYVDNVWEAVTNMDYYDDTEHQVSIDTLDRFGEG